MSTCRGFDSLVQHAMGLNLAEGQAWRTHKGLPASMEPKAFPTQALDYGAGAHA